MEKIRAQATKRRHPVYRGLCHLQKFLLAKPPVFVYVHEYPQCTWRGGRVVYGSSLENWRGRKVTVGSNPTLSAILRRPWEVKNILPKLAGWALPFTARLRMARLQRTKGVSYFFGPKGSGLLSIASVRTKPTQYHPFNCFSDFPQPDGFTDTVPLKRRLPKYQYKFAWLRRTTNPALLGFAKLVRSRR